MGIRTWMFLALLAMTLLGMGGISAAHAEDIDCDNGGYSNDDSDTADCQEEKERQRISDCESNTMATESDIESFLVNCPEFMPTEEVKVYQDVPEPEDDWGPALPWDSSESVPVVDPPEPPQPPEPAPEITPEPEVSCDETTSENPEPMTAQESDLGKIAVAEAERHLGKPYKYSAKGPDKFDCSGLVSTAWRAAGVKLPRGTAEDQCKATNRIDFNDKQLGDLLFFDSMNDGEARITHVGIYIGKDNQGRDEMIHASSPRGSGVIEYQVIGPTRLEQLMGVGRPTVDQPTTGCTGQ